MKSALIPALALLLSHATLYAQKAEDASADLWADRRLMTLPEGCPDVLDFSVSQNLEHVVCLVGTVLEQDVVFDGKRYPSPKLFYPPQWEPKWNFVAWTSTEIIDQVASDGRLYVNGDVVSKAPWFGPARTDATGEVVAYWRGDRGVQQGGGPVVVDKAQLVVNDKEICSLENGYPSAIALSANGKVAAYSFTAHLTKPGQPLPTQSTKVFLGKKEMGQALFIPSVTIDERGRTMAYQHGNNGEAQTWVFIRDKQAKGDFSKPSMPVLCPKGRNLAFLTLDETEKVGVVQDGKEWKDRWDLISQPVWDPKGNQLAVIANQGMAPLAHQLLGHGAMWFANQSLSLFDRENQGFRTLEPEGRFFLVVDGKSASKDYLFARDPVWSADSKQVAFRAKDELGWRIVVGEQVSDVYHFVTAPRFSKDGTRVGFGAQVGTEIYWRTMDLDATTPQ